MWQAKFDSRFVLFSPSGVTLGLLEKIPALMHLLSVYPIVLKRKGARCEVVRARLRFICGGAVALLEQYQTPALAAAALRLQRYRAEEGKRWLCARIRTGSSREKQQPVHWTRCGRW